MCAIARIGLGLDGCNVLETKRTIQLLEVASRTLQQYVEDVGEVSIDDRLPSPF